MANSRSARKRIRSSERKHVRNRAVKSAVRTKVIKARHALLEEGGATGEAELQAAIKRARPRRREGRAPPQQRAPPQVPARVAWPLASRTSPRAPRAPRLAPPRPAAPRAGAPSNPPGRRGEDRGQAGGQSPGGQGDDREGRATKAAAPDSPRSRPPSHRKGSKTIAVGPGPIGAGPSRAAVSSAAARRTASRSPSVSAISPVLSFRSTSWSASSQPAGSAAGTRGAPGGSRRSALHSGLPSAAARPARRAVCLEVRLGKHEIANLPREDGEQILTGTSFGQQAIDRTRRPSPAWVRGDRRACRTGRGLVARDRRRGRRVIGERPPVRERDELVEL